MKSRRRATVVQVVMALALLPALLGGILSAIGAAHAQPIAGSVLGTSVTDMSSIWGWMFLGGILVIVIVLIVAFMGTGVGPKSIAGGVVVGVLAIVISVAGVALFPASTTSSSTQACTSGSCTAAVAVSLPYSSSYPTGQTQSLSPLSVQVDTVLNSSTAAGAMCLQNGVGASHACAAGAHNYFVVPLKLSRTDNINATEGFTVCLTGIQTLTNSSTGITYSPIGYTPSTSTSPGVWKVQWSTGSIGGANPTQPAPTTTSQVACDLVGVPAFGSTTVTLSVALPGSNSTSANFGYLATQYTNYPFDITISGGSGASPASIPVNIEYTGAKSA